jgi:hypothetical protein
LALSLALAVVARLAAGDFYKMINPGVAVVAWFIGISLAVIGAWPSTAGALRLDRRTVLLVSLLIVAAFLMRGIQVERIPLALSGDEGAAGKNAVQFIRGEVDNIFGLGWDLHPALYFFIQSIPISLLGNSAEALRMSSVIAGALEVGALYLMGRAMFGHSAGLLAGVFLAGFHFHVHWSRLGQMNIWAGLGYVVTLGALWHGWQTGRRSAFVVAGLGLGLSQYFYGVTRLLFVIIPLWLLVVGLLDWRRLKRALPDLLLMGVIALVCSLPLAWYYTLHIDQLTQPMNKTSIFGPWMDAMVRETGLGPGQIVLQQIDASLRTLVVTPFNDTAGAGFYPSRTPVLRPVEAALFLAGLGALLLRRRWSALLLIVLWLLASLLSVAVGAGYPAPQRYVIAAAACALLIGYALSEAAAWFSKRWPAHARMLSVAALALAVGVTADSSRFYFQEFAPRAHVGRERELIGRYLGYYLKEKSSAWQVVFFGYPNMGFYTHPHLTYLAPHIQGIDMQAPWGAPDNPKPARDHVIFVLLPGHEGNLPGIQARYPDGRFLEQLGPDGRRLYSLYEVESSGD